MVEGGLDIALMVVMGYFVLRGIFRGVVKEVVTVLGLFVSFWAAGVYYPLGAQHLSAIFDQDAQRNVVSFFFIFAVVYFLLSILSIFVDKIVKLTISPIISALLGAVVGVIKGVLLCAIFLTVAQFFLKPDDKFFTNSQLWPFFQPVAAQAKAWMPESLRQATSYARQVASSIVKGEPIFPTSLDAVDWKTIKDIMAKHPEMITPPWRDKLRSMPNPAALTKEDIKRFVEDHRNLFTSGQPLEVPQAAPNGTGQPPSWPQPATE